LGTSPNRVATSRWNLVCLSDAEVIELPAKLREARNKQRDRVTRPWSLGSSGWRSGDRHRELGDVCGGEALLKADASARLPCDEGSRLAAMMRAVTPNTAQSSTFAIAEPVISRRPERGFGANETSELPGLGESSIERSAIALESASVHRPPGNRAINDANLCAAAPFGSWDNSAASIQGSTSSRARAERTLRGISTPSAPIGA
jgi:hypothetical protein